MKEVSNTNQSIISVSDLNKLAKDILENEFSSVWVQGEVSNFFSASSGHWYFSLKDENSEIRCAMFAGKNSRLSFEPKDGDNLILNGTLSIFEGRGQYQMIIDHIELAGEGALLRAFEDLKNKLTKEGLFDFSYKKTLPTLPMDVCVITSPDGAVIKDIINVLKRRAPLIKLTLIPTLVQGEQSVPQLMEALKKARILKSIDLIILARGGGSVEDLWSFNNEDLARSIYECPIPIISAIGHETDFTISDFVSDLRAPTPSAAAEIISQPHTLIEDSLINSISRLGSGLTKVIGDRKDYNSNLRKRLRHPGDKLRETSQRLDYLSEELSHQLISFLALTKKDLEFLSLSVQSYSPVSQLKEMSVKLARSYRDLVDTASNILNNQGNKLAKASVTLEAVSPLSVLSRGYSIITNKNLEVILSSNQLALDEEVTASLLKGKIKARVTKLENED